MGEVDVLMDHRTPVVAIGVASSTYLDRSTPGGNPKLVGVGEGVAEMSRDCSGIGD